MANAANLARRRYARGINFCAKIEPTAIPIATNMVNLAISDVSCMNNTTGAHATNNTRSTDADAQNKLTAKVENLARGVDNNNVIIFLNCGNGAPMVLLTTGVLTISSAANAEITYKPITMAKAT